MASDSAIPGSVTTMSRSSATEAAFRARWIIHPARFPAPITGGGPTDRQRLMDEILYQDDEASGMSRGTKSTIPGFSAWLEGRSPRPVKRYPDALGC